jgi:hypothetical protein
MSPEQAMSKVAGVMPIAVATRDGARRMRVSPAA